MIGGPIPTDAAGLAHEVRRLAYDVRRPHLFQERKRELADAVARLADPRPRRCEAQALRLALTAARRERDAARTDAARWQAVAAASLRHRRSRRRASLDMRQMALPFCDPAPRCESSVSTAM